MINWRIISIVVLVAVLSAVVLHGQDGPRYRDFRLGGSVSSVAALSGVAMSEAKTIHQRPALLQELRWRPSYFLSGSSAPQTDPVEQIVFSFYNDQLSKLVVDYSGRRTEGMTDADMIDAISTMYGLAAKPILKTNRTVVSDIEDESGTRLARWGDAAYVATLYRSSYGSGFKMIVTSVSLDALARTAEVQSLRLDERERPQRELAEQTKEAEAARASQEKARLANKAVFQP